MRKYILIMTSIIMIIFCLSGFARTQNNYISSDKSKFVCVDISSMWEIVYNKETKVMYAVSYGMYGKGIFTLLVDADGNPMLYEE